MTRHVLSTGIVLAVAGLVLTAGCPQPADLADDAPSFLPEPEMDPGEPVEVDETAPEAPTETEEALEAARETVAEGAADASESLRSAAQALRIEAEQAGAETRDALSEVARGLDEMAAEVDAGAAIETISERAATSIARSYQAMALEHYSRALAAAAEEQREQAADELLLAARYVRNAHEAVGERISAATEAALDTIGPVAEELATSTEAQLADWLSTSTEQFHRATRALGERFAEDSEDARE